MKNPFSLSKLRSGKSSPDTNGKANTNGQANGKANGKADVKANEKAGTRKSMDSKPNRKSMDSKARSVNGAQTDLLGNPLSKNAIKKKEKNEKKEAQRKAREEKEAALEQQRKEREAREAEKDTARDCYGILPPVPPKVYTQEKLEQISRISASRIGERVAMRARIHTSRAQGSRLVFILLRQNDQFLQAVLTLSDEAAAVDTSNVNGTNASGTSNGNGTAPLAANELNGEANISSDPKATNPDPKVPVAPKTPAGLAEDGVDHVSQAMVRFAEGLHRETVVLVEGILQAPPESVGEVKSASKHDVELKMTKIFVLGDVTETPPFTIEDASRPVEVAKQEDAHFSAVTQQTRFQNRLLDLRTPTSNAIFRLQAAVCKLAREYLDALDFIEIHSSKFQKGATESGASVFNVEYFGKQVSLAQSPQLAKQMCIAADMERVYEVGPVFRAENSNTHRHLTEFTGVDLEMAFDRDYHEVMDVIDGLLKHIFAGLQSEKYSKLIELIKQQFPHDDFEFPEKTVRLNFAEGIDMLRAAGYKDSGSEDEVSYYEDLSTAGERKLGELVKEKYGTDYYILDKFPLSARPFYTMPDPHDDKLSNSFDIFMRGEEILSGGQRIHQATLLEEQMTAAGVEPEQLKEYVDGFRWGAPMHGGGGIGLERVVMLFLKLGNIRYASLFPRDPRSFPNGPMDYDTCILEERSKDPTRSDHPSKLDTKNATLEELIAAYGDSTNTSWLDDEYTVWRHPEIGTAVGYVPSEQYGYAASWGKPLCKPSQLESTVVGYLSYLKENKLKPIWLCLDEDTMKLLTEKMGWTAVLCVAEQRVDPVETDVTKDSTVRRKIHQAEREGVEVEEVKEMMDASFTDEVDKGLAAWQEAREGQQIHTTQLQPWKDQEHRRYFFARNKEGEVCGLLVLALLAPENGYQVKWALDFPNAPKGTIEYLIATALKKLGMEGVHAVTFGVGTTGTLESVANVSGFRFNLLKRTYGTITKTFNLGNKSEFRKKFQAGQEAVYVCYPKRGLGMSGVQAIMDVLTRDE